MKRSASSLVALVLLTIARVSAEEYLITEEAAVSLAREQNLDLLAQRLELGSKQLLSETAWSGLVPAFSAGATLTRSNTETTPSPPSKPYDWNASFQLRGAITISAAELQGITTARLDYLAGRLSYEQARLTIEKAIRKAFYRLILQQQQLAVTDLAIATSQQSHDQAKAEYDNGRVPRRTLRQAQLALENTRLLRQRQEVDFENTLASFKNSLGLGPADSVRLEGSIAVDLSSQEEPGPASLERRPDVAALTAQIETQKSRLQANRLAQYAPTLTLAATLNPSLADPWNPDNPAGSSKFSERGSISLTLSANSLLAFLPFSEESVTVQTSDNTLRALEVRRRNALAAAEVEVASALRALKASEAAMESLRLGVTLAEEVLELTREAYEAGGADFLALQTAEEDLRQAQYSLLSEQYTYLSTMIDLDYARAADR